MLRIGETLVGEGNLSREHLGKALKVQQQLGSRLGTVLLELGMIDEPTLLASLGRQRATKTVTHAQLSAVPATVVRMIPAKLAARYGVVPFELKGRTLFVASRDVGDALKEDEIGFLTSCLVRTCIALEVRVFEALQRCYRVSCPERHQALARRLAGGTKAASRVGPGSPRQGAGTGAFERPSGSPRTPLQPARPASAMTPSTPLSTPTFSRPSPPVAPVTPEPRPEPPPPKRFIELDAEDAALLGISGDDRPQPTAAKTSDEPVLLQPTPLPWLSRRAPEGAASETVANKTVANKTVANKTVASEAETPVAGSVSAGLDPRPIAAHPLTTARDGDLEDIEDRLRAAASELKDAEIRDEIADVLLAFAEPYFRRRVLLVARKETIVGWRGEGEGVENSKVRSISVPVNEPSVFLGLRGADSFWLGALPDLGSNEALVEALGGAFPKDCVVLPVALRSRIVCYLYGDNFEAGVTGAPLAELRRLTAKAGLAFEVYILKNKIRIS